MKYDRSLGRVRVRSQAGWWQSAVGSKLHGEEKSKDGPVATVQESGHSDFQSLASLPHTACALKTEMCKGCSKSEMSLVLLIL